MYTHRTVYTNYPARYYSDTYTGWWLVLINGVEYARHETEYTYVPLGPDDYTA